MNGGALGNCKYDCGETFDARSWRSKISFLQIGFCDAEDNLLTGMRIALKREWI